MFTKENLQKFFEDTNENIIDSFVDPLNKTCEKFEINSSNRIAMFIAQVGHESGGLNHTKENLNYKAAQLLKIFPRYFENTDPAEYEHQPEKIANRIYSGRMGNGSEASGDGWKFRGRGLIQLTGKENYTKFSNALEMDLDAAVNYLETPEGAAMSAGWYWNDRHLNDISDTGDIEKVTRRINGGTIGLEERIALYNEALTIFS